MHADQIIPKRLNEDELEKVKKKDHPDVSVSY